MDQKIQAYWLNRQENRSVSYVAKKWEKSTKYFVTGNNPY